MPRECKRTREQPRLTLIHHCLSSTDGTLDEEEDANAPPLSALQRLTLSRKKASAAKAASSPTEEPRSLDLSTIGSGAKRAQGIAGLSGGGRAKMAKQGLAALAPPQVQEQTGPKSKLASLAAARKQLQQQQQQTTAPQTSSPAQSAAAPAPAKPMSKLQMKMAAAKAAKEKEAALASGAQPQEATAASTVEKPSDFAAEPTNALPTTGPSGLDVAALFPGMPTAPTQNCASKNGLFGASSFASQLCLAGSAITGQAGPAAAGEVPGGSPFAAAREGDARLQAFAGPSPDDAILQARQGTRLGVQG